MVILNNERGIFLSLWERRFLSLGESLLRFSRVGLAFIGRRRLWCTGYLNEYRTTEYCWGWRRWEYFPHGGGRRRTSKPWPLLCGILSYGSSDTYQYYEGKDGDYLEARMRYINKESGDRSVLFHFSMKSTYRVFTDGPWTFDNHTLVLESMKKRKVDNFYEI